MPGSEQALLRELVEHPREDLSVEYKGWLDLSNEQDRAVLAKALLCLANSGGGYVVIGFAEQGAEFVPQPAPHDDLAPYSQDNIHEKIIAPYADPRFQIAVHLVTHSKTLQKFPVIRVPGSLTVPIRCKRTVPDSRAPGNRHITVEDAYYIRKPKPECLPAKGGADWGELIRRSVIADRDSLLSQLRDLLQAPLIGASLRQVSAEATQEQLQAQLSGWMSFCEGRWSTLLAERLPDERPSRFESGTWSFAYVVHPVATKLDLTALKEVLREVKGQETGWALWLVMNRAELAPYPHEGDLECWMAEPGERDAAVSDYWRVSPRGFTYISRGYQEDSPGIRERIRGAERALDPTLPIWRVGEGILHSARLAARLGGQPAQVIFAANWRGLRGRVLQDLLDSRYPPPDASPSQSDVVAGFATFKPIDASLALPALVQSITRPLYESFGLYEIPELVVRNELERMRRGWAAST